MKKIPLESPSREPFLTPSLATIISTLIIAFAILLHGGIIRIKGVTPKSAASAQVAQAPIPPSQPTAPEPPTEDTSPKQVSVDDDPVLGDKNAPITLIEFSDYECPFCKRHFEQALPEIKKDYIDTGKVKLVFRDYPLSFHDPMATTEAIAANCAREQGGDPAYFRYHDEIFKRTKSNGNGLTKENLYTISTDLGLNTVNLTSCVESEKYKDEVAKDFADGSAVGVSGTPGFFIGKSTADGKITGTPLVGAQPYSAFKIIIDQMLK